MRTLIFGLLTTALLLPPSVDAQQGAVAGRVVNQAGQPLAGAQILVEATGQGAISDAQGRFRLEELSGPQVTLQVVMLGHRTVTQTVDTGTLDIRIVLPETAIELDEVVVTGTPTAVQKRSIGNAVATFDAASAMEMAPATSLTDLVTGKTPGMVVRPAGGAGAGARVKIRGTASLSLDAQPLIYIDGVRVDNAVATGPSIQGGGVTSRLNDLNVDDIQSIEIIKGPAAATLYGTEAASGVIQVITKKGRPGGGVDVGVTLRQGVNWFPDPASKFPTNWYQGPETDGQVESLNVIAREMEEGRDPFRYGHAQGYAVNVRGGTDEFGFYLSGGYDRDEGYDPANVSSRYALRTNLSASPNPAIDIDASLGLNVLRTQLGREESPTHSIYGAGVRGNPRYLGTPSRGFFTLPPEVINDIYALTQDVDRFTASIQVNHRPTDWLSHRITFGGDFVKEDNQVLVPYLGPELAQFVSEDLAKGFKNVNARNASNTTVDYAATVTAELGSDWTSNTSGGVQYYRKLLETLVATGDRFPAPGVRTVESAALRLGSDDFVENVTLGTYVQQQFSHANRLFLTGAVRADDNSAFGRDFDVQIYPKVSASWVVSEEPFWNQDWVDVFRLRSAFGTSGQQPDAFAAIRTFAPVTGTADESAATPQSLGNPELGPERGQEFEIGFEAGFLEDRLAVDFTFYHQVTKDAILLAPVAPSTGFPGSRFINGGEVRNRGMELAISGQPFAWEGGGWDLALNLSTNDSEILSLNGLGPIGTTGTAPGGPTAEHRVGFAPWSFFLKRVVSAEFNPDGTTTNVLCDGGDVSDQPLPCDGAPRIYMGKLEPDALGSISSEIGLFDRVRIHALLDFQLGRQNFAENDWARCSIYRICRENVAPMEFSPERIAEVERAGSETTRSIYYVDADFMKLRELSLDYRLPDDLSARFGAERASITVAGRNLYTWTGWPQFDPESTKLGLIGGFDQAIAPPMTQFVTSINLTF